MREIKFRIIYLDKAEARAHNNKPSYWTPQDPCADLAYVFRSPDYAVGQFTGLKDKNDKEIYGKDIARKTFYNGFDGDVIGVVEFKSTKGYYLNCSHTKQTIMKTHFDGGNFAEEEVVVKTASLTWAKDCIEIIGDIHSNPKLLKEQ